MWIVDVCAATQLISVHVSRKAAWYGWSWKVATVKKAQTVAHGNNETLANQLYADAGVAVPEVDFNATDGNIYSRIVAVKHDMGAQLQADNQEWMDKVRRNFVVDAWLANHDVFGMGYDNIGTDENGEPWRIDNGGALMFRAMGEPKADFGSKVGELDVMRKGKKAAIFGPGMTEDQELDGAERVLAISPSDIKNRVAENDLPPSLADTLIARRAYIAEYYGLPLPESIKHPDANANVPTLAPVFDPVDIAKGQGKGKDWMPMNTPTAILVLSTGDKVWLPDGTQRIVGMWADGSVMTNLEAANQKLGWAQKFGVQDLHVETSNTVRPTHNQELHSSGLSKFKWQRGDQIVAEDGTTYNVMWANNKNGGMLVQTVGPEGSDPLPPFIMATITANKTFTVKRWDPPAPIEKIESIAPEKVDEPVPTVEPVKINAPEGMAVEAAAAIKADLVTPLPKGDGKPAEPKAAAATAKLDGKQMLLGDNTVAKPGDKVTSKFGGEYVYVKPKGPYAVVTDPNSADPDKQLTKIATTLLQPGKEPVADVPDTKAPTTSDGKVPQLGMMAEAKDGTIGEITQISPNGKFLFITPAGGTKKIRKSTSAVKIVGMPEVNLPEETPETPEETSAPDLSLPDVDGGLDDNDTNSGSVAKTFKDLQASGELKSGDEVSKDGVNWMTYDSTVTYASAGTYFLLSSNGGKDLESYHASSTDTWIVKPAAVETTPEPVDIPEPDQPHFSEDQFNALEPNDTLTLPSGVSVKIVGWAHSGTIAVQKDDGTIVALHLSTFKPGTYTVVQGTDNVLPAGMTKPIQAAYDATLWQTPLSSNKSLLAEAIAQGIPVDEAPWMHHDVDNTFWDLSDATAKQWDPESKTWVEGGVKLPEEMKADVQEGPSGGVQLTAESFTAQSSSSGQDITFYKGDDGLWYNQGTSGPYATGTSTASLIANFGYLPPAAPNKIPEVTTTSFDPALQNQLLGYYTLSGKTHTYINQTGGDSTFVQDTEGNWHPEGNDSPELTYDAKELVDFFGLSSAEDQLPPSFKDYTPLPGEKIVKLGDLIGNAKPQFLLQKVNDPNWYLILQNGKLSSSVIDEAGYKSLIDNPSFSKETVFGDVPDATPADVVPDALASPLEVEGYPSLAPTTPGQKVLKIGTNGGDNLWLFETGNSDDENQYSSYGTNGDNSALGWTQYEVDNFESDGATIQGYQIPGAPEPVDVAPDAVNNPDVPDVLEAPPTLQGGYVAQPGSKVVILKAANDDKQSEFVENPAGSGTFKLNNEGSEGYFDYTQDDLDAYAADPDWTFIGAYEQPALSGPATFGGYEAQPGDVVINVSPLDGSPDVLWLKKSGADDYTKIGSDAGGGAGTVHSATIEGLAADSSMKSVNVVFGTPGEEAPALTSSPQAGAAGPIPVDFDTLTTADGQPLPDFIGHYAPSMQKSIAALKEIPEGSKIGVNKGGGLYVVANTGQAYHVTPSGQLGALHSSVTADYLENQFSVEWLTPSVGTHPGVNNKPVPDVVETNVFDPSKGELEVDGKSLVDWVDSTPTSKSHSEIQEILEKMSPLQDGQKLFVDTDGDLYVLTTNGNLMIVAQDGGIAFTWETNWDPESPNNSFLWKQVTPAAKADGTTPDAGGGNDNTYLLDLAKQFDLPVGDKLGKLGPNQEIVVGDEPVWALDVATGTYLKLKSGKYEYGQVVTEFDDTKSLPTTTAPTSISLASAFIDTSKATDKPEATWPGKKPATPEEVASWGGSVTKDGHIPVPGLHVQFGKFQGQVVSVSKDKTKVVTIKPDGTKSTRLISSLSVNGFANYKEFAPKQMPLDVPKGMPLAVEDMETALASTMADGKFRAMLPGQDGIRNGEMFVYRSKTPSGKNVNRVSFTLTSQQRDKLRQMLSLGPAAPVEKGDWDYISKSSNDVSTGDQFTMRLSSTPNADGTPRWKIDPDVKPPTHEVVSVAVQPDGIRLVTLKDKKSGEVITSRFHANKTVMAANWNAEKIKAPPPTQTTGSFNLSAESTAKGWKKIGGSSNGYSSSGDGVHSAVKGGVLDGVLEVEPGNPVPTGASAWGSSGGAAFSDGNALRYVGTNGVVIEISSVGSGENSFKGQVVVTLPEGTTAAELNSALALMGVEHKPLTQQKAMDNMVPMLRTMLSYNTNDIDTAGGTNAEELFKKAGKEFGINDLGWQDVLVGVDPSTGKTSYYWSQRVRDKIEESVKAKNGVNVIYRSGSTGTAATVVSTALFGTANAVTKRLTGMVHTPSGKGLGVSAASDATHNAGHGGFLYGSTVEGKFSSLPQFKGGDIWVVSRADALIGRIQDYRAYPGDVYGNPPAGTNSLHRMMTNSELNDIEVNGGLPIEATSMIAVSSKDEREKAIDQLKKQGVHEINGMPVEKFIILKSQLSNYGPNDLPPVFIPPNARPILDLPESYADVPAAAAPAAAVASLESAA